MAGSPLRGAGLAASGKMSVLRAFCGVTLSSALRRDDFAVQCSHIVILHYSKLLTVIILFAYLFASFITSLSLDFKVEAFVFSPVVSPA